MHLRQAQTIDKTVFEYWTHALSYLPTADMRFYVGAMKRHWQRRSVWFTSVTPADLRKVLPPHQDAGRADDPRHRRRRAGRKGPRLGEPQAVEARAATGVLPRHC